ncbi:MAG: oligosaccharide flippase family protein [Nitrospirota bacterium]
MIEKLKHLLKDSLIYGLGSTVGKFIGVLLVPIFTRIFSPAEYGVIDLIGAISSIISFILVLGLDSAVVRFYYADNDIKEKQTVISTGLLFQVAFSIVGCIILFFCTDYIAIKVFKNLAYSIILKVSFITIPFTITISFLSMIFRINFAPWKYSGLVVAQVFLTASISIYLVVILRMGIIGVFYSSLITNVILTPVGLFLSRFNYSLVFSIKRLKSLLSYGIPLVPASFSLLILNLADRFFLMHYSTLEQVGLYSIGIKLSSLLLVIVSAFQLGWAPFAFSISKEKVAKEVYSKVLTYYMLLSSFIAIGLSIFACDILKFVTTSQYVEGFKVVGMLSFGIIAYGAYHIVSIGVHLTNKTSHIAWTLTVAAVMNLLLNFLLVPKYGMLGASFATLVSYFISTYLLYRVSQKYYPIEYEIRKVTIICFVSWILIIVGMLCNTSSVVLNLILKLLIIGSFPLILFLLNIFEPKEIAYIKNFIGKVKGK